MREVKSDELKVKLGIFVFQKEIHNQGIDHDC